ncbi:aminotransferase class V-fold PLP-dependent enzyme [Jatrophihabitans endophyticus]|uniref:aminotransferase class V-fold PLP-dependent enzyme n=1 Tax=Jatrophihabitans endophyticus TaxID=1206085 RepID=UPI001356430C|nr:aminotransferase class V-fold PLP-dependent enzyme [Jatrophihabitans endophyticus]
MIGVDVARVRGLYPTLATRTAQLDGSFAALQPESVIRAVIATLRSAPAQPGSRSSRSQQSATRVLRARRAVADLVRADPADVVLGQSAGSLLQRFVSLLASDWQLGDEIVLNRLDADLVTQPFTRAARNRGTVVRWAEVDLDTGDVPAWQYDELVGRRTRVVTVSLANPATGTVPDVRAIADLAHEQGALVVVDAGVAPLYAPIDTEALGADLLAVSATVLGGPTAGAVVARPGLLDELGELDDAPAAERSALQRFENFPLPVELLDGVTAAVDHLADLDENPEGTRRDRLVRSVTASARYAGGLFAHLDAELRELPGVTVLGASERALPVTAYTVAGCSPDEVGAFLQRHDVSVWTGASGLSEVLRAFGADEFGGAVFLGVMPHTTAGEVEQFVDAMRQLCRR